MGSTDLYWLIMRLYPYSCSWYCHFYLISPTIAWVDPPDNLIYPKQQKQNPPKSNKSAHRDVSTPMLCHFGTFFSVVLGWREFIVRCTKQSPLFPQNHLFGLCFFTVCGFWKCDHRELVEKVISWLEVKMMVNGSFYMRTDINSSINKRHLVSSLCVSFVHVWDLYIYTKSNNIGNFNF